MGRILAIDFGSKRIGLAMSDPLNIIATSLPTIENKDVWEYLKNLLQKEQIDCIVVGYPKRLNNQPSESIRFINPFIKKLVNLYPEMKVELYDERFTSKIAFQAMIDGGLNRKARQDKAMVDKISANLILQSYMEFKKKNL